MASLTKKDQATLYARAQALGHASWEMDNWADQLQSSQLSARAPAHRQIAKAMRDEAEACREWADEVEG